MDDQNHYPETPSQDSEQIQEKSSLPIVLTSLLIVGVLAIAGYMFYSRTVPGTSNMQEDSYAQLELNDSYVQAEELFREGNLEAAKTQYEQALRTALDADQEGQILYKIALTETHSDPQTAIGRLKGIIKGELYSDVQKAYAAQRLALMFYRNSDPELVPIIFAGDPYAGFYQEGDTALALRRLFDYASSFYPLAISELRSALWYADRIKEASGTESFDGVRAQYLPTLQQKLADAEHDIERTKDLKQAGSLIPEALYLKAVVYARLASAGLNYDWEQAMQEALNTALVVGGRGSDGSARYAYAMNLFLYEDGREQEAFDLLTTMVENIDSYPTFKRMFENEKDNVLGQREALVQLANAWPEFESLLISLGWPQTAFAEQ